MSRRLNRIQHISLRDRIVTAIRDAIIQGKFRPGEKIPEEELAEQLDVSRTPIREAIRILEQQGLLETRPKNGTYVATLHWGEVEDSLQVRMMLEEFAVRQAIERMTLPEWDALCDKLQSLLDNMDAAVVRGDSVSATELDIEWHTLLIGASRNNYLSRTWRVTGLTFLVWSPEREIYPFTPEKWAVFHTRHQELLTALRTRDPDQCAQAVRFHIQKKISDLHEWLKSESSATEGAT